MPERIEVDEIVDRMEQTRSKNNVVWMTALRIALKAEPEKMKEVIREIAEHDREIQGLWRELGAQSVTDRYERIPGIRDDPELVAARIALQTQTWRHPLRLIRAGHRHVRALNDACRRHAGQQ